MNDSAGAPVTMISVGSGSSCLLEPNQLQADRQANVISTKTFNRYALVRYEGTSVSRSTDINYSSAKVPGCLDSPNWPTRDGFQNSHLLAQLTLR
jgi:hypothetical protein